MTDSAKTSSVEHSPKSEEEHPAWCTSTPGKCHEHAAEAIKVDGRRPLLVELAMDADEVRPHVSIIPERKGKSLTLELTQAVALSRAIEGVVRTAGV